MKLAVDITSAYVSYNALAAYELPKLIDTVFAALLAIEGNVAPVEDDRPPVPAVPVAKSLHRDYIICLEDGRKFKSLKRHLGAVYGLTPEAYRRRWGLPPDYPMVAPAYAAMRSAMAKSMGLGTSR